MVKIEAEKKIIQKVLKKLAKKPNRNKILI